MKQFTVDVYNKWERVLAPKPSREELRANMVKKLRKKELLRALNETIPAEQKYGTHGELYCNGRYTVGSLEHPWRRYVGDAVGITSENYHPYVSFNMKTKTQTIHPGDSFIRHLSDENIKKILPMQAAQEYATAIRHDTTQSTIRQIVNNNRRLVSELNGSVFSSPSNPFYLNADGEIMQCGSKVSDNVLRNYIEGMRMGNLP